MEQQRDTYIYIYIGPFWVLDGRLVYWSIHRPKPRGVQSPYLHPQMWWSLGAQLEGETACVMLFLRDPFAYLIFANHTL